jgi:hypothetical protein
MADEIWTAAHQGDPMDDDRLLAYALGLDDDPELARAAAADDELARRLETVRAEVQEVAAGVRAAVPAPDDSYTDLSDARWAGLQEYFTPAQERPTKAKGSWRWLRVLAPVAVVALAVAVGVTVIERQSGQSSTSVAERSAKSGDALGTSGGSAVNGAPVVDDSSLPTQNGGGSAASSGAAAVATGPSAFAASPAPEPSTPLSRLVALRDQMNDFALVVLATAEQASDGFQDFVVVRVLHGEGPKLLHLKLAGRLADVGRLHLLMLEPLSESATTPAPESSAQAGGDWAQEATATAVATAEAMLLTSAVPVVYTYGGDMAVARELPEGVDPGAVTVP